jgi:glycosyltransferase involved in cell wall biosynthesis
VKILFYNHTGKVSGAERVLQMILAGLDHQRFDPAVLCPAEGTLTRMASELNVRTISIAPLAARFTLRPDRFAKYLASFVHLIRAARRVVISEAPEIVHANSIRAGLVMSVATTGMRVPVVWHVHDLLPRHPLSSVIRWCACLSRRNHVLGVSQAVSTRFQGKATRFGSVKTILNGVDLNRFQPNIDSRKETRRTLGVSDKEIVIGSVGQLTSRKGQRELINAFAETASVVPNAVLLIVGGALFNRDDEYAASLMQTARASNVADRIRFLGERDDVPALMRAFDLLVVNSKVEPFGLTVVEAMASGTAVLASAVDGIKEIVRHGESGWLVDAADHDGLVRALIMLVRDNQLRERLARRALKETSAHFSAERFTNEIQDFYRRLAERNAKPVILPARSFKPELKID